MSMTTCKCGTKFMAGLPESHPELCRSCEMASLRAEVAHLHNMLAMTKMRCPCQWGNPCSRNCTCGNGNLSGGCRRCCTYGSMEQRAAAAAVIAARDKYVCDVAWDVWNKAVRRMAAGERPDVFHAYMVQVYGQQPGAPS